MENKKALSMPTVTTALERGNNVRQSELAQDYTVEKTFVLCNGMHIPPFTRILEDAEKQLEDIRNLELNPHDVILCTFPKSGTNWIHEILTMLLEGSEDYAKSNKGYAMLEAINVNEDLLTNSAFRILNTHVPYRHLPEEHVTKGIKLIHVTRNPKDVYVSFYNHFANDKMFGEDPEIPGTWDNFINLITEGKLKPYRGWCNYILDFEREQANNQNIFTLSFEDMKKDSRIEIERLAKFLEVTYSKDLIEMIAVNTRFAKMATAIHKSNRDKLIVERDSKDGTNFFFRKGEVGDWRNWFTVSQNERFDAMLDKEMKDSKIQFKYEV